MSPEHPLFEVIRKYWLEYKEETRLFLVGGAVRDFLQERKLRDIDFLLEGEFFSFCAGLQKILSCKTTVNKRLLTSSFQTRWGTVDFTRARREIYDRPGSLPRVEAAGWREDLYRRDFTFNTLALPLTADGWGELVDVTGGLRDLQAGLIRVLHENSFRDDPTRLLRVIRYRRRLGFTIEEKTLSLMMCDWEYLKCVSGVRRLKEWILLCEEPAFPTMLDDLYRLGGWKAFLPGIPYRGGMRFCRTAAAGFPDGFRPWIFWLLQLLKEAPEQLDPVAGYFDIGKKDYNLLCRTLELLNHEKLKANVRKADRLIEQLPPEGQYFLFKELFSEGLAWEDYCEQLSAARMPINGNDLLQLGCSPGPGMGRLLARLAALYREGAFDSKEEGLNIAFCILKEGKNV